MNESKWTPDKRYPDTFKSQYGEMVELYGGTGWVTIQHGWYYWAAGALMPEGPYKTRRGAMQCGKRQKS